MLAKELGLHGRCIIYDRRGFHRSAPPVPFETLDLVAHVEDAAAVLAALHTGPAIVIGRSTGGLIAVELARHFPDKVKALVLLEPALFTIDPEADAWARDLRLRVLDRASCQTGQLAEAVVREALGDSVWESFPEELQQMFVACSPAVLAEIMGRGMDLSEDALVLGEDELWSPRAPHQSRPPCGRGLCGPHRPGPIPRPDDASVPLHWHMA